jgi:hypothetical protein
MLASACVDQEDPEFQGEVGGTSTCPAPLFYLASLFQPIDSGQEILGKDDIYKPL